MNTQECQTDSPEITLGDKFRIAREALHLSLEEVAEAIALRPSILKSLEENQFVNAAIPATFMRGYVRNYAKFLRIPESEWTNLVHFGHDQENDLGKNARATHAVNQYTSHHRWVGYLTALMVLGVGMLMNVVKLSGGIDLLVEAMENVMGAKSAAPIMAIIAGVMSFFSSGLGVVFPSLIPLCRELAAGIGADDTLLVAMVVIGGTIAGYTPISTTGALIMAGVAQQENAEERFLQNKIFIELFAVSFINLAVLAILSLIGIYSIFV